jgi:hypothetical protein
MAKIKIVPKIIIIIAIVGGVLVAGNYAYDNYRLKHPTAPSIDAVQQLPSPDPVTPQQNLMNQKMEQVDQANNVTPAVPTPRQQAAQQAQAPASASSGADHSFDAMKDMGKMK